MELSLSPVINALCSQPMKKLIWFYVSVNIDERFQDWFETKEKNRQSIIQSDEKIIERNWQVHMTKFQ